MTSQHSFEMMRPHLAKVLIPTADGSEGSWRYEGAENYGKFAENQGCLQARPCIHKALAEPQDAWSQKLGRLTLMHSVWTVLVSVLTLHETFQAAVRLETSSRA